jgi:Zinc carboxypeptidase
LKTVIDVAEVLRAVPTFTNFCSVRTLEQFVKSLREHPRGFRIEIAGMSEQGAPIHHVRFGHGSLKVLLVGFPHANEPIGGLTVFSLLSLLAQGHSELLQADVEWHIVPCIDPDGASLNEAWTQTVFSLESYLRGFHRQELCDQAECSFPINHKGLVFNEPTPEAQVLQDILTRVRPDLYYSLHNAWVGGAFFALSRDIDPRRYLQLHELLAAHHVPLRTDPVLGEGRLADGVFEVATVRGLYDRLEKTMPHPERALRSGECSWEYLERIKPDALTLVTELPYVRHPLDGSDRDTGQSCRQLKLRLDAENKYLVTMILEEWERVVADVDARSPFYRKVFNGIISQKEQLPEGLPAWATKTREILFSPDYSRTMTEGERFDVWQSDRFFVLCHCYEFVRLLRASPPTAAVERATQRLAAVFRDALQEVDQAIDFRRFALIDLGALARVQLGSGLIVLNSLLHRVGGG